MPVALAIDWEAIQAHALIHGVRQAARDFGVSEEAVKRRCSREGWVKDAGKSVIVQPLPKSMAPTIVPGVPKPSEAARNALRNMGEKSRLNLARAVRKGSIKAARMDGAEILAKADKLKSLADTGDKVFGWSGSGQAPILRLELIAAASAAGAEEELPAIDVEAEVTPQDQTEK